MMRPQVLLVAAVMVCASVGFASAQPVDAPCLLTLDSDPPGAYFKVGSADSVLRAVADTVLAHGAYRVEASMFGYRPLVHEFELAAGDTLGLRFVMLAVEPVRPLPEALGLEYQVVAPLIPEEQARSARKKYNTMAEVFAIIPLLQGVMAAIALGGGHDYFSAELMVTGVGLSVGSFLLGRHVGSRRLKQIRQHNEVMGVQNLQAETHNIEVDTELRRVHAEAVREWQAEAAWRGRVQVTK